eukprot:Skav200732  [mRNA]  locus=scaffold274:141480:143165:+ [translate_table: standard]
MRINSTLACSDSSLNSWHCAAFCRSFRSSAAAGAEGAAVAAAGRFGTGGEAERAARGFAFAEDADG